MAHNHFYEISAKDNYQMGIQLGELFGDIARSTLEKKRESKTWSKKIRLSKDYYAVAQKYFSSYMEELKGYAKASRIAFEEFWPMSLEDDFDYLDVEKCTTVVTNDGRLISHNEDWAIGAQDMICVLKKTIDNLTTFELFYYNTLGGSSVSINSYGYAMMINTLTHTDRQVGVPRNVISRWLSETRNPERDFERLQEIPRSLGYNHLFANTKGEVWDIECSATKQVLIRPALPYVHANHFLSDELKSYEENDGATGTYERYEVACDVVKERMSVDEITFLNSKTSHGNRDSIMNDRTIGKIVIDLENLITKVWLRREDQLGWVDYKLDFIHK